MSLLLLVLFLSLLVLLPQMLLLQEAKQLLEKFVIGTVKAGAAKPTKQAAVTVTELAAAAAADPTAPKV